MAISFMASGFKSVGISIFVVRAMLILRANDFLLSFFSVVYWSHKLMVRNKDTYATPVKLFLPAGYFGGGFSEDFRSEAFLACDFLG